MVDEGDDSLEVELGKPWIELLECSQCGALLGMDLIWFLLRVYLVMLYWHSCKPAIEASHLQIRRHPKTAPHQIVHSHFCQNFQFTTSSGTFKGK
jgi:hypothetical protein